MISKAEYDKYAKTAIQFLKKAHMVLAREERKRIEVADFGLSRLKEIGLQLLVYENNARYCAKELVLLPRQICPEHKHPYLDEKNPGKQETFRCRYGEVFLYVEGEPTKKPKGKVPPDKKGTFTAWKEIVLRPGQQYTMPPNTLHWFQAGKQGAVISEFSSTSVDEKDLFTDPHIERITKIN